MQDFEQDPSLNDLLTPDQLTELATLLSCLAGADIALSDVAEPPGESSIPIELNLETVGWVTGEPPENTRRAAAKLAEFITFFIFKYRLAATLHRSTTEASYEELKQQNEALRISEARYRELAGTLQEKVDSQVEVVRQAQQELYESARLRSVGQLAAGVAHEINNPIGFIKSNLQVAREYVGELEAELRPSHQLAETLDDFRELLAESLHGATRIASIVANLKSFSSIDHADYSECSLNQLIEPTLNLLQTNYQQSLEIRTDLTPVPDVQGHAAKLSQALFNVLDNAAQAVAEGGSIRVKSSVTSGGLVRIDIMDTGFGVPESKQGQVFDPFFTTRKVGAGTGLGLTVARDIVLAHGGQIRFKSQAGKGTWVTIELPVDRT